MGLFAKAAAALARKPAPQPFGTDAPNRGGGTVLPTLGRRPAAVELTDLVASQIEAWDPQSARQAIQAHDTGSFVASAQLCDFMLRDDRVMSALTTRLMGLQGLPFAIAPARKAAKAAKVAAALEEDWPWICPPRVQEELLQWEQLMGFALAEIVWDTSGDRWVPTLKVWHPQHVYYRLDLRRYVAVAAEGLAYVEPGAGKWLLYTRHGHHRAWIRGAVRALVVPFLARQYAWRDWGRYNEVHGLPIKQARVPAQASDADKRAFFAQIRALGSTGALLAPEGSGGQRFALELVEAANQQSWQAFERCLLRGDAAVNLVLLGQNMSGGEIREGSHAAAKVADGVRDDFKLADATSLAADFKAQVVRPWTVFNFGDEGLTPSPGWDAKPAEDKAAAAQTFKTAAEGAEIFARLGAQVDMPRLIDRFGLPLKAGATLTAPADPAADSDPAARDAA